MKHLQQQPKRPQQRSLWQRTWKNSKGRVVLFQRPNIWIIAWATLTLISLFAPAHTAADVFWWLATVTLAIWSLLEICKGANYFRRALGAFVLLMVVASVFGPGR